MTELTKPEPIKEIDILWITAGLGCDGDTIEKIHAGIAQQRTSLATK